MKKIKKIKLEKETIVNLNDSEMKNVRGGYSSQICSFISTYVTGKGVDYTLEWTESVLKENTFWVGCTTDDRYSQAPGQPGCVPNYG